LAEMWRQSDGYVPFALRFKAWWHGIDPNALVARSSEQASANPLAIMVKPEEEKPQGPKWTDGRVAFCRRLWEDGPEDEVVDPGGAIETHELMRPMVLSASNSAADLGAGLGGGTRLAASRLGVYIDGFEPEPDLATRAADLSHKHGMARKAKILSYEPDRLDLPERRYTGILCRDRVFRFAHKEAFLERCALGLKPGGHLVITDLNARTSDARTTRAIENWTARETDPIDLWTPDQMTSGLTRFGLEMRYGEDATNAYRSKLLRGWARFVDGLSKEDLTRDFVDELMREAEYWLMLVRALESGDLRHYRYHAIRGHASR
jgi:SAM-dependent methyltransferase